VALDTIPPYKFFTKLEYKILTEVKGSKYFYAVETAILLKKDPASPCF
jgi:hypothetical protein